METDLQSSNSAEELATDLDKPKGYSNDDDQTTQMRVEPVGEEKEANGYKNKNEEMDSAETQQDPDSGKGSKEIVKKKKDVQTSPLPEPDNDVNEDDNSDEEYSLEEFGDPSGMDPITRVKLYEKGRDYMNRGNKTMALKCYLRCLKGLEETNGFFSLPQCLRAVADIYYSKEEYGKAVQFVQAEKLYYETALVDTSTLEKQMEENLTASGGGKIKPELVRAQEYENLAKICLEKKQPQLALDYQAKATKLRQQALGEDHPTTVESLDFFTVIYGEVGKQQYSESMEKLEEEQPDMQAGEVENGGGLRQRKVKFAEEEDTEKPVRPSRGQIDIQEQELWISHTLLWILFGMCTLFLSVILFYIYCKIDVDNKTCVVARRDLAYYYLRFKYYFYYYTEPAAQNYG